jgi:hypothetical protein
MFSTDKYIDFEYQYIKYFQIKGHLSIENKTLMVHDVSFMDSNSPLKFFKDIEKKYQKEKFDSIVFNCLYEAVPNFIFFTHIIEPLKKFIEKNNIKFYTILSRFKPDEQYVDDCVHLQKLKNIGEVIFHPIADMYNEWNMYRWVYNDCSITSIFDYENFLKNMDKPFFSMNLRPSYERVKFIDKIKEKKLVDEIYYSLACSGLEEWENYFDKIDISNKNLKFPIEKKCLDKFDKDPHKVPIEFYKGLLNIVIETDVDRVAITEKTFQPLLYKKPFVVLGFKNVNKKIKDELGFQLFDDIFDYTFDKKDNIDERISYLIDAMIEIKDIDLIDTYQKVKSKIDFNYNHLLTLNKKSEMYLDLLYNKKNGLYRNSV